MSISFARSNAATLLVIVSWLLFTVQISVATDFTPQESSQISQEGGMPIEKVISAHAAGLMSIPGVVGVGQGLCGNEHCIKVFLLKKDVALEEKIPKQIEGYKVATEVVGSIKAHNGQ